MQVRNVKAYKIFDSRAKYTIEVAVETELGTFSSNAPSGASVSTKAIPTFPRGVDYSIKFFNEKIAPELIDLSLSNFDHLKKVESTIANTEGTENLGLLGGNAQLALEYALLKALSYSEETPLWKLLGGKIKRLPRPLGNVLGGGAHAGGNASDIQEFLIYSNAPTFSSAANLNAQFHNDLKKSLKENDKFFVGGKSDEGAWVSNLSNITILDLLAKKVRALSKTKGYAVSLGVDAAASELLRGKKYIWKNYSPKIRKLEYKRKDQMRTMRDLISRFDLQYIEDPLEENDFEGFAELQELFPDRLICGDDLLATNPDLLKKAIEQKAIRAAIVKPNQVGSLIKAKAFIDLCFENKITPVVSHRSGSTCETILADLAVAWKAPFVKFGVAGGERIAKLNRLLEIERSM